MEQSVKYKNIIETALLTSGRPLSIDDLQKLFEEKIERSTIRMLLDDIKNDWNEKSILCFDEKILNDFFNDFSIDINKSNLNSNLLITSCEFLVAKDGSILVSANQIKSYKVQDIPSNIIVLAKTSQLSETVSKGLEGIRIKYSNNLPSNITSIKNFNCEENEKLNFLTYGTSSKNLYLILLEDL